MLSYDHKYPSTIISSSKNHQNHLTISTSNIHWFSEHRKNTIFRYRTPSHKSDHKSPPYRKSMKYDPYWIWRGFEHPILEVGCYLYIMRLKNNPSSKRVLWNTLFRYHQNTYKRTIETWPPSLKTYFFLKTRKSRFLSFARNLYEATY